MYYDPILCMNVPDGVRTKDSNGIVLKKENGYELGVNSQNTIYLAFPGETSSNPHMYLGKDNPDNRKKAEELFNKFKNIKHKDAMTTDAYIDAKHIAEYLWTWENAREVISKIVDKMYQDSNAKNKEQAMEFVRKNYNKYLGALYSDVKESVNSILKSGYSKISNELSNWR